MSQSILRSFRAFILFACLLASATHATAQKIPVTTSSDAARVQFIKGRTALHNAEWSRSVPYFNAALAIDPNFAMAHLYHAIATQNGREEHLRQAISQKDKVSEGERMHIESYALEQKGDIDGELALLKTMARKYPDDPQPMMIVAFIENGRGNAKEAVAAAKASIATDPSFSPSYNQLGYAEMDAGNMTGAEQAFRDYIRMAPSTANAYDSYGEYLMNAGRLDESKRQFEMALTHDSGFGASRDNLTRIAIMQASAAFVAAINRADLDGAISFFGPGAVMSMPDGTQVSGLDAIEVVAKAFLSAGKVVSTSETQEIIPMGEDFAYQRAAITNSIDGTLVEKGIDTYIWLKTPDGWKIARDTWTNSIVAAAPAENTSAKRSKK